MIEQICDVTAEPTVSQAEPKVISFQIGTKRAYEKGAGLRLNELDLVWKTCICRGRINQLVFEAAQATLSSTLCSVRRTGSKSICVTRRVPQAGQVVNSDSLRITVNHLQTHTNYMLFKIVSTFQAVQKRSCFCSMDWWMAFQLGWRTRAVWTQILAYSRSGRLSLNRQTLTYWVREDATCGKWIIQLQKRQRRRPWRIGRVTCTAPQKMWCTQAFRLTVRSVTWCLNFDGSCIKRVEWSSAQRLWRDFPYQSVLDFKKQDTLLMLMSPLNWTCELQSIQIDLGHVSQLFSLSQQF